jgi:F-type H+-transporting ATPase subunit delta
MAGLSTRYATAVFELEKERGTVNESLAQAIFLRDTLDEAECRKIVSHPHISAAKKMDFIKTAFAGNISENLLGMVYLAINKNRESFLVPALNSLIEMINEFESKTTAQVISAVALTEAQLSALKATLSTRLNKQVDIAAKIDPSVIGGFSVFVDGYLIDRTIKKQFNDLSKNLKIV